MKERENKMFLIDKNKITFEPMGIYNCNKQKLEITGIALLKDVEKIQPLKQYHLMKLNELEKK
jgi:hypothetical protein